MVLGAWGHNGKGVGRVGGGVGIGKGTGKSMRTCLSKRPCISYANFKKSFVSCRSLGTYIVCYHCLPRSTIICQTFCSPPNIWGIHFPTARWKHISGDSCIFLWHACRNHSEITGLQKIPGVGPMLVREGTQRSATGVEWDRKLHTEILTRRLHSSFSVQGLLQAS